MLTRLAAVPMLLLSGAALACEPALTGEAARRVEAERYVVAYRPVPAPIAIGEFFALEIAACGRQGAAPPDGLSVDARMPAHRHGMNYRPTVTREAPGRFRAEGLMLHMPGEWELVLELAGGGRRERLAVALPLD